MIRIITLSPFLLALSITAQPTLQYADLPASAVDFVVQVVTDPGSAQEPSDGANQTWDLSMMQFGPGGTARLEPAAGTPYAATYPAGNWTFSETPVGGSTEYNYMSITTAGIDNVATHVPTAPNVYSDYERILKFPLSLGDSYTDSYVSPDHTGSETWTYAGNGTLITSLGTFTNLVKMKNSDGDMVLWNVSPISPRVIANSNGVQLLAPGNSEVQERAQGNTLMQLFPVPAIDMLTVSGTWLAAGISVFDMQGRCLLTAQWTAGERQQLSVAQLATGTYQLVVQDANGRRAERFVKQ